MDENCLFCQIASGKEKTDMVYEDDALVVFKDIRPHAPVHLLIVPKMHIRSVNDLTPENNGIVSTMIACARDMAKKFSIDQSGYKLLFNVEKGGGQVIFHLHMHLIGGWSR